MDIRRLLLRSIVSPEEPAQVGVTALHPASSRAQRDVTVVLLEKGCLETAAQAERRTPLDGVGHGLLELDKFAVIGMPFLLARGPAFRACSFLRPVCSAAETVCCVEAKIEGVTIAQKTVRISMSVLCRRHRGSTPGVDG